MAVLALVGAAGDVDPEVFAVGGFDDGLVKVRVRDNPVEPAVEDFLVGMCLAITLCGVLRDGQADVAGFAKAVLGGIDASDCRIELGATVAAGDDDGLLCEGSEGFEDVLAKDFQIADDFLRRCVVDLTSGCGCTSGKL